MKRSQWLLLVLGLLCIGAGAKSISADGLGRWNELMELLRDGKISSWMSSMIMPLFASPLALLDLAFGTGNTFAAYANFVFLILGLFGLGKVLMPLLGDELTWRFLLILVFGSMFPFHAQNFFGEIFTAFSLAVGSAALCAGKRPLGSTLMVLGAANTPASMVPLGFMALARLLQEKKTRDRVKTALIPVTACALMLLENRIRRSGFFDTGVPFGTNAGAKTVLPYSGLPGFSYPMFLGIVSLLFSYGKGLLFFAPGFFTPVVSTVRFERKEAQAILGLWFAGAAGFILIYSKWWSWSGDEYWGPRYTVFCALPASLALAWLIGKAKERRERVFAAVALLFSLWIGFDGRVFGNHDMTACYANGGIHNFLCSYTPEYAAWARPFVSQRPWSPRDIAMFLVWVGAAWLLFKPLYPGARAFRAGSRYRS